MFQIGSLKIPHQLVMAPLCDITHKPFRQILKRYGAGLVFTQMISAKAITMGDQKSMDFLSFDESERPIGFQLFGHNADDLSKAAKICQDLGPDLIDLNMGCPAQKIVSDGGGSALLKNPESLPNIFEKMRSVLKIPLTIKMRAGWDTQNHQSIQIAQLAEKCGIDAITLHARTRSQGYAGKADWSLIKAIKESVSIPVIGNGDVTHFQDVDKMMASTQCDAVMVGRAAFSRPWIFKSYLEKKPFTPSDTEFKELILNQYKTFFEFFGEKTGIKQMRKFLCAYTKGIKNGSLFRKSIITLYDWDKIQQTIHDFFNQEETRAIASFPLSYVTTH